MAFSLQDIQQQLAGLFGGGGAATSYAAPDSLGTPLQVGGQQAVPTFGVQNSGFGFNPGTGQLALSGLGALGSLIQGNRAFNLAKDQFKLQKDLANTNLNNSIKSYNNTLEDRLTARGVMQGDDSATTQAEIDRKRLTR